MPIVATGKFHLLDMVVLLRLVAQSEHHSLEGREHGRTITLAEVQDRMWERQGCADSRPSRLASERGRSDPKVTFMTAPADGEVGR
jgi:hypothetical protein